MAIVNIVFTTAVPSISVLLHLLNDHYIVEGHWIARGGGLCCDGHGWGRSGGPRLRLGPGGLPRP